MAKIGYARVSTHDQRDSTQIADLEAYGCDRIFTDHGVSGKLAERPALDEALAYMRAGDVFVITRMSRAARNLRHMLDLAATLQERDISLVVLKQQIDTTTPTGRLVFNILASIDEFTRELILEGTMEGIALAREEGRLPGQKPKLNEKQAAEVRKMLAAGRRPGEIMELFGISRATVYRYANENKRAS